MTKQLSVLSVILLFTATVSNAENGTGLGVILGEPTGVSFKTWLDNRTAIDAAAAWSFSENDSFQLHADYLMHPFNMPKPRQIRGSVLFYYGVGGRLKLKESDDGNSRNEKDDIFGIRFPVGLAHRPATASVEFFAEIVPVLDIIPDTDADLNAALGGPLLFQIMPEKHSDASPPGSRRSE